MNQLIFIRGTSVAGNTERFANPLNPLYNGTTPIGATHVQVAEAGTIRNLKVRLDAALGGGDTLTFRLMVNGSASALTVTITDPATTAENSADDVSISVGDTLALSQVGTGAPAATGFELTYEFEGTDASAALMGFGTGSSIGLTNPLHIALLHGALSSSSSSGSNACCGVPGTINHWRIVLSAAPSSTHSRSFVIYKNDVAQDGTGGTPNTTITISGASVDGNASFTLTVAQNDKLRVQCSLSGTPANAIVNGCLDFVSDIANRWPLCSTLLVTVNVGATSYAHFVGQQNSSIPGEATVAQLMGISGVIVSGIHVELSASPGSGNSYTVTLRQNGSGTAQTVTISDSATTGDGPATPVTLSSGDIVNFEIVPTSTPNSALIKITFLMTDVGGEKSYVFASGSWAS